MYLVQYVHEANIFLEYKISPFDNDFCCSGFCRKKYSNKLSMKALVEKDILMKKQEKEMWKAPHFFYVHLSRELKVKLLNSFEPIEGKGTQRNLGFFNGSARRNNKPTNQRKSTKVLQILKGKCLMEKGT